MFRRTFLAGATALATTPALAQTGGRTRVVFWHAMNAPLGDEVNKLVAAFNASQTEIEVVPVFKGTYPETLTAAIAAWRAGQAPNLVQMFEVGTGSMLAAGPAVKQVWELAKETGVSARSGAVYRRRARLLQPARRPPGLGAVQLQHGDVLDRRRRVREGRPRPGASRPPPGTTSPPPPAR